MSFKVGDTVVCVSIDDEYIKDPVIGKTYKIINFIGDGWFRVELPNKSSNCFLQHDFELVKEKSEKKGTRYNEGKLRWRNFPMFLMRPVVEVGAAAEDIEGNPTGKYPTYNFLKGLNVADCMDCLKRHLDAVDDPKQPDIDPEDGKHHLAKVAWNALVALHYINNPELDDRYKGEE